MKRLAGAMGGSDAGGDQSAQVEVGQRRDEPVGLPGPLTPANGSTGRCPVVVSQATKRRTASYRMRALPGAAPAWSMPLIQVVIVVLARGGSPVLAHQVK